MQDDLHENRQPLSQQDAQEGISLHDNGIESYSLLG